LNSSNIITIVQPFSTSSADTLEQRKSTLSALCGLAGLIMAFLWQHRALLADTMRNGTQLHQLLESKKQR
ncbi:MAG: hypothetical protein IJU72_07000, partial [Bacteroidales bacterium]|nr:hypothetical protein [Bacteroidales bacterium]